MNPARRLLAIYDSVMRQGADPGMSASQMWAGVFGLPTTRSHENDDLVVECLQALRGEIAATLAELRSRGCTDEMLQPAFARLAEVASPVGMHSEWRGMRSPITAAEVRITLAWAAWALPDQEAELEVQALKALSEDIDELERSANAEGVSQFMRALALRNVALMRSALRVYSIRGVAAVNDALQTAAGTAVIQRPIIEAEVANGSPQTKTVASRLRSVMNGAVKAAEGIDKLHKGIEAAKSVYNTLSAVWDALPKLPPPGT